MRKRKARICLFRCMPIFSALSVRPFSRFTSPSWRKFRAAGENVLLGTVGHLGAGCSLDLAGEWAPVGCCLDLARERALIEDTHTSNSAPTMARIAKSPSTKWTERCKHAFKHGQGAIAGYLRHPSRALDAFLRSRCRVPSLCVLDHEIVHEKFNHSLTTPMNTGSHLLAL